MKTKIKSKTQEGRDYKIYIRNDLRTNSPIQQLINENANLLDLLNNDNPVVEPLVNNFKIGNVYLFKEHLLKFIKVLPDIKVLIFDIDRLGEPLTPKNRFTMGYGLEQELRELEQEQQQEEVRQQIKTMEEMLNE